ncbi:hypothetical protein ACTHPZ_02535 [Bacillus halotolerans]|uniref:nSTAND3 domain-containing NTPase n=1 Tax=Bacillus halotolerans TaxID=260554 RepID=UPI003F7BD7FB
MSIEIVGTKAYDYQYLMTVYIALRSHHISGAELIVEAKGGEDAELRIPSEIGVKTIEIQIKSERSPLALKSLVTWLAHFPGYIAENNLLSRLETDPLRSVLFITQARCLDDTQPYCIENFLVEHREYPLSRKKTMEFLNFLSGCYERKDKALAIDRNTFCKKQSESLSEKKSELQRISKKILIMEQMDENFIRREILSLLHTEHSIPQALCESVLLKLIQAVKEAKNNRSNVMPNILRIIRQHNSHKMFMGYHTERKDIDFCYTQLKEQHVLLLTGISFCGKTHTAEYIADKFRDNGYICFKAFDIGEASRILTDMNSENRLCILEDPFGGSKLSQEAVEIWSKLNSLVTKMGPHRKLIVTSRIDLLQMITKENDIKRIKTQFISWCDLTVTDSALAKSIWEQYCKIKGIPHDVKIKILRVLNYSILQPGQLRHLAFIEQSELINKSTTELEKMAKVDAVELGQSFLSKENTALEQLLIILGMCTSPSLGVSEEDLFNIIKDIGSSPQEKIEQLLEHLETHGYIKYINNYWLFSHPTYYESAMFVIEHQGRFKRRFINSLITYVIDSTDSFILLNIIKKFKRLLDAYQETELRLLIINKSFSILEHNSPAIRDAVLPFLVSQISELSTEHQKCLINFVEKGDIDEADLEWKNGLPLIKENILDVLDFTRLRLNSKRLLDKEEYITILNRLAYPSPENIVLPEEAWKASQNLKILPDEKINVRYLRQLMTYDEAIIRKKTAYFIMRHYGENEELVDIVFRDGHPSVIKNAILGCFQSWPTLSEERRLSLKEYIKYALKKPANCAATNNFFVKFAKEHSPYSIYWDEMDESGRVLVWNLWAETFPVFLNSVPIMLLEVDEPYLFTSIKKSADYISDEMKFNLSKAWFDWLDRVLDLRIANDYGLAVADFLLSHISNAYLRKKLGHKLLNYNDSALVMVSLSEYIYSWEKLSYEEKKDVLDLMNSERTDLNWIWAVALTRKKTPDEIINLNPELLKVMQQPIETWSNILPESLIADCLAVVTGYPSLFACIGLTGTNNNDWRKVLFSILNKPVHRAFPIAQNYLVKSVFNDNFKDNENNIETIWMELCGSPKKSIRDSCFELLLHYTIKIVRPNSKRFWTIFFENIPKGDVDSYIERVLTFIESISRHCDRLDDIFGEEIGGRLISILKADLLIFNILMITEQLSLDEQIKYLEIALSKINPRLIQTVNVIRQKFSINKFNGGTPLLRELVNEKLDCIFKNRETYSYSEPEIENWICKHKTVLKPQE